MEITVSTTFILLVVALFGLGVVVGWMFSGYSDIETPTKLKTLVAVVVSLGWISATFSGIFISGYTVSPLLHSLMGAIVGYFFTRDGIDINLGSDK